MEFRGVSGRFGGDRRVGELTDQRHFILGGGALGTATDIGTVKLGEREPRVREPMAYLGETDGR